MSINTNLTSGKSAKHAPNPLQYFYYPDSFPLERGGSLPEIRIGYQTFGTLNREGTNVVWVCHALTANTDPLQWWSGLVGEHDLINPQEHFIVCANVIGSCYGSTGPKDFNPENGQRYLRNFPNLTIRDMVRGHQLLQKHLGIRHIYLGLGGSMGGQQILEWAITTSDLFKHIALIATAAKSSPWGIAIRTAQRMAIEADPSFYSDSPKGGWKGMEAARAMAMISYRNNITYNLTQQEENCPIDDYKAESYQRYQGQKLSNRFDARTYYILSKAMDTHHVGRNRGSWQEVLATIAAKALVVGIEGDLLFPAEEIRELATAIPKARLAFAPSNYGHDGFLVEAKTIAGLISDWLTELRTEF